MKEWAEFYEKLFNFREIRYFDIQGKQTGLISQAMTSPCGKIRIPINERPTSARRSRSTSTTTTARASSTSRWARATSTRTVEAMRGAGVEFLDTPDTYYELLESALPGHGETSRGSQARPHPDRRRRPTRSGARACCCRSSPRP